MKERIKLQALSKLEDIICVQSVTIPSGEIFNMKTEKYEKDFKEINYKQDIDMLKSLMIKYEQESKNLFIELNYQTYYSARTLG